mmetsp:Transcript_42477/g.128899  ORF Transcript_42477/g.128899 Transcript_42477/m.128899 type:complete len:229 (-) Transcript_42477:510-1196(-)
MGKLALQLQEREKVIVELREKVALLEFCQSEAEPIEGETDTNAHLRRVTEVQKHTVVSIELLYRLVKRLEKAESEDNCEKDAGEMQGAMKLAEKASLVQGELEVSLRYIELRLRNTLESMAENSKSVVNNGTIPDATSAVLDFSQITRIQMEALTMLRESEDDILKQMHSLKDKIQSVESEICSFRATIKMLEEAAERKEKVLNELRTELSRVKFDVDTLAEVSQISD